MAPGEPACRCRGVARERGFTYLGLLLAVAVLSVGLAGVGELWSTTADRQRSNELEWIGSQYVQAIGSYYHSASGDAKRFPPDLEALLSDARFPFVKRHLRRIYPDPYSGKVQWGLVQAHDGGVAGVYSLAEASAQAGVPARRFVYRVTTAP